MMKKIFFLAAASLILTACEKNDDNPIPSDVPVKITATIGGDYVTRAKDNAWSAGDRIGITATTGPAVGRFVNMEYSNGENGFTGTPIYFYDPMTLSAYYPFDGTEGSAPGKEGIIESDTRAGNQTSENQPNIDFLFAGNTEIEVKDDKPVINFSFEHKMSKLTFILVSGNEGTDIKKIVSYSLDGLVLDGTFNTADGVCAVKDGSEAERLGIDLKDEEKSNEKLTPASLIVFPQKVEKLTMKIHDSDNQDYSCDLNFGTDGIKAGNNYQFTIKVSKTTLDIVSSIQEWTLVKDDDNKAMSDD